MDEQYRSWMLHAIEVAKRGWGDTHPNPVVGALIIENDEIVAEGYHARAGELHAERDALRTLGRRPKPGATMVVTLEPCSTHGRTPPCVDGILEAGISRVIVGAVDPNPDHVGGGFEKLRAGGVEVISGIEAEACGDLNLIFNHCIQKPGEAFFAAKVATTLDGKIATRTGHSQWITGPEARADVAHWRRCFPAILVGTGTVVADDPRLTSRIDGQPEWCPARLIVDTKGALRGKDALGLFTDEFAAKTIVLTTRALRDDPKYLEAFKSEGGRVESAPLVENSHYVDFNLLKRWCIEQHLHGVYIEPGAGLMKSLLQQEALDYLFHYTAPKLIADSEGISVYEGLAPETLCAAIELKDVIQRKMGTDCLIRGAL